MISRMLRAAALICALAVPAAAEEPQTAPAYFVDTVVATGLAQQIARACGDISLNPQSVAKDSDALMTWLLDQGIDSSNDMPWIEDADTKINARVEAFLADYDLIGADEAKVCAAGLAEIEAETPVGRYLLEVAS